MQPRRKPDQLRIRASAVQRAKLAEAARARHMNVDQFVLSTSLDAAEQVLAQPSVAGEGFDDFCRRLEEEPNVILALKAQLEKLNAAG